MMRQSQAAVPMATMRQSQTEVPMATTLTRITKAVRMKAARTAKHRKSYRLL